MQEKTAVLLIDPLNDFLHPEGKLFPALKESIDATDTVDNLQKFVKVARSKKIPILYCQHKLYEEGQFEHWNHMSKEASEQRFTRDLSRIEATAMRLCHVTGTAGNLLFTITSLIVLI